LRKGYDCTGSALLEDAEFNELLCGLLEFDPEQRMSPDEILRSEFMQI